MHDALPSQLYKTSQLELPSAELKLDVANYAKVACSLLDIPVYSSTIQSLHVLFTLFAEFRENQHFGGGEGQGNTEMAPQIGVGAGAAAGGGERVIAIDVYTPHNQTSQFQNHKS